MIISSLQNRFLRAIIKEFRDQLIQGVKDGEKITPSAVKIMLSYKNENYPRDDADIPLSFTKIDSKQASNHAEFIFLEGGLRGFVFTKNEEEWERLLEQAHNYQGK